MYRWRKLQNYSTMPKVIGASWANTNLEFAESEAAAPAQGWYWHLIFYDRTLGAVAITGIKIFVQLTYYVKFFGKKELSGS